MTLNKEEIELIVTALDYYKDSNVKYAEDPQFIKNLMEKYGIF